MIPIDQLLQIVVNMNASDLHLTVNRPPTLRINGRLRSMDSPPLNSEDTNTIMKSLTSERSQQEIAEVGGCDYGFAFGDVARFRVSVFKQRGDIGMVLRLIPNKILSFEELGLPPVVKDWIFRPRGLFLVTGPTGSGKTTTLATMIDFINTEVDRHILTIEDPIEYYHHHKKSLINQREVGVDVPSFQDGLRRGLRQDPDVVLVGEMRDLETISTAITAAETGHLVFGTLHTTGSARTINRIIDAFPVDQQEQIRAQLSASMVAVISQQLLARADGKGRVAAFEIMTMTSAIENLIRENKTFRIDSAIQTGKKEGMILLDDFLFSLFMRNIISFSDMMKSSQYPDLLKNKVKQSVEAAQKKKKK